MARHLCPFSPSKSVSHAVEDNLKTKVEHLFSWTSKIKTRENQKREIDAIEIYKH